MPNLPLHVQAERTAAALAAANQQMGIFSINGKDAATSAEKIAQASEAAAKAGIPGAFRAPQGGSPQSTNGISRGSTAAAEDAGDSGAFRPLNSAYRDPVTGEWHVGVPVEEALAKSRAPIRPPAFAGPTHNTVAGGEEGDAELAKQVLEATKNVEPFDSKTYLANRTKVGAALRFFKKNGTKGASLNLLRLLRAWAMNVLRVQEIRGALGEDAGASSKSGGIAGGEPPVTDPFGGGGGLENIPTGKGAYPTPPPYVPNGTANAGGPTVATNPATIVTGGDRLLVAVLSRIDQKLGQIYFQQQGKPDGTWNRQNGWG